MGKRWNDFKMYVSAPPPDIIAKVEYRSHFLNILGVFVVCTILFLRGYWYVIFAFIFSMGVSWAQGMSSLARYRVFASLLPEETFDYILMDHSFTRRRQRLIKKVLPFYIRWLLLPGSFLIVIAIFGLHTPTVDYRLRVFGITILAYSKYFGKIALSTIISWLVIKFILIGGIIEHIKRRKLKNGINGEMGESLHQQG